jgi:type IV secretion/conjugal transfer VirB4 family ATPase
MVKIARVLKDYREAGSLNALIALWGFVDDAAFLTKSGAVGLVFRLTGVDYECLDHAERHAIARRFEQALRQLDESFRVYQYVLKRPAAPAAAVPHANATVNEALQRRAAYLAGKADALFELELTLVVLCEGWNPRRTAAARCAAFLRSPRQAASELLSTAASMAVMGDQLDRAAAHLRQKADAFIAQLADTVRPQLLPKTEAFRFFRRLVNYTPHKTEHAVLTHDAFLDFFMSDSAVECHRDHLTVDDFAVKVMTMKEAPAKTFAHILQDLYAVPSAFIACLEWQRVPNAKMRRDLHTRRRHFFNKKVSLINYVSTQTKPEEMLVDDSATATVNELGQSLTEMEVHGHFFGACSLTIVAFDRDARRLDQTVAACVKAFAGHDGALYEESYNLLNAWLAVVPGNSAHNLRRLTLLNTNAADLSFLFTLHTGSRTSAHLGGQECLAVFETEHRTPYFWNLHHNDVGHALIQGATGSGKSFLVNFILTHAQKYDPTTVIFDLGGSYEKLTRLLGGSVWRMGLAHRDFTINPFCLAPTQEHRHFLFSFVRVLLQSSGQYQLTQHDDRDLYEAVENIYALDAPQRRLITLVNLLPRALGQQLHRWVQGGPYAALFDNVEDTLTFQRVQCFDFEGLDKFPLVLEPLLFYILHRANAAVQDRDAAGSLKLFVLDEAWRFARDATVKAYITEALKTWRKRNAAMILATQSTEDFATSDLLRTVIESCPTKFFLANPGMDIDRARELFHLNHTEAGLITHLLPRQQALLKRPDVAKVINLHVDPESYWIYTNTPPDNAKLQAAAPDGDVAAAVQRLTASA